MNTPKILSIEDDAMLNGIVSSALTNGGFLVIVAAGGAEGLQKAKTEQPQLILLDIMMADIDGFEVLRQLKADDATKNIPVVILSNLGKREEIERGLALGATTYIIKSSILPHDILSIIRTQLSLPEPTPPQEEPTVT